MLWRNMSGPWWRWTCRAHISRYPCSWSTCEDTPGGQTLNYQSRGKEWSEVAHRPDISFISNFFLHRLKLNLFSAVANFAKIEGQRRNCSCVTFATNTFIIFFFFIVWHISSRKISGFCPRVINSVRFIIFRIRKIIFSITRSTYSDTYGGLKSPSQWLHRVFLCWCMHSWWRCDPSVLDKVQGVKCSWQVFFSTLQSDLRIISCKALTDRLLPEYSSITATCLYRSFPKGRGENPSLLQVFQETVLVRGFPYFDQVMSPNEWRRSDMSYQVDIITLNLDFL